MTVFDPLLRAPLLASWSMGVALALIGVCLLYEKRALVGEALSHAAYPGVVVGALFAFLFSIGNESTITLLAFAGALLSCSLALFVLKWLHIRWKVSHDSALSFVLASSFALALLCISALQEYDGSLGRLMQSLLIGQVATVSTTYAAICFVFALMVVLCFILFFRSFHATLFDREFVIVHGLHVIWMEWLVLFLLSCAVMLGIRTMGVVLLTSACIFPAICSRFLARSLQGQFFAAAFLGGAVSALGVIGSHTISLGLSDGGSRALWLPTGPLIAILFMGLFLLLLFFAPTDGLVVRSVRSFHFTFRCQCENSLKSLWKLCSQKKTHELDRSLALLCLPSKPLVRAFVLLALMRSGYLSKDRTKLILTPLGLLRGQKLVRLHRLWELYLVRYCGMSSERVHPQAEEMEHVLTPEVERELVSLLNNPAYCPHRAPIPPALEESLLKEGKLV